MIKNNYALSPVISIVVVLMIVASSMATIILWGVPYVQNMESESRKESINMQFGSIADSINELASSTPGDRKINPMDVSSGSLEVNGYQNKDRNIIWYSLDSDYNFTVTGLNLGNCFLAGTKVLMADGSYKNIEDVKIGDMVLSYNVETGKILPCRVSKLFSYLSEEMTNSYYLIINDGLRVTPNHKFYSDDKWVQAGDLKVGDNLLTKTQNIDFIIKSIDKIYKKEPSYDLQVEQCHNYFVSIDDGIDVLVHNDNDPSYIWVTPDTYETSCWRWVDKDNAIDGDINTESTFGIAIWEKGWSDYLELNMYNVIPCSGFQINAKWNEGIDSMEITLWNGSSLKKTTTYSSWNNWPQWQQCDYGSNYNIDRVKIRFYNPDQWFRDNWFKVYEFNFKVPIPECQVLAATEITETTAKLNGQITNNQGLNSLYYKFEYDADGSEPFAYYTWPYYTTINLFNLTVPVIDHYGAEPQNGLTPVEIYYFRAEVNHKGVPNDCYSNVLSFITKPYPPSNIQLTTVTNNSISYSWTKSQCATGAVVKTKVLAKTVGWPTGPEDNSASKWYDNLTGSSDTETGLITGQRYNVSMWSWGEKNGVGKWSSCLNLTLYTKPNKITNLNVVDSESMITLSWTKGTGANKTVIRRSTRGYPSAPTSGIEVYNDTGTICADTDVEAIENYYYSIWAYDSESGYFSDLYENKYVERVHQLTITSPEANDKWRAGTNHIITWAYGSIYENSTIEIALFGKVSSSQNEWTYIEDITDRPIKISDKSFVWWIPTSINSGEYKINISEINDSFYIVSSTFYIKPLLDNIIDYVTIDLGNISVPQEYKIRIPANTTLHNNPTKQESFYFQMISGRTNNVHLVVDLYWLSYTDDILNNKFSLNGTICMFLYDLNKPDDGRQDVYFGNIWLFDSDSLMYESPSSGGTEKTMIEYGGILNSEQNSTVIKQKPNNVYEASGTLSIHEIQTVASSLSSASGRKCSVLSNLQTNSDIEQGDQKVYNFKIQFYGDNANLWLNYFLENFMFDNTGDLNTLYYIPSNPNDGVRFSFAHSFIELKIN